ncbi:MAG: CHAD domain-containing protein [Rhodoferax sp.]|uniref:CYTH and CHAD domain-containing protein n=1 Tax=Rhodoferax sp. TaxID=50421 RepID=UPI00301A742A
MKPHSAAPKTQEIELKLALPTADPASLAKRLARSPVLARRTAKHQFLHNIYFDTPEQFLRQQRIALRLRRVDSDEKPQWLQTLKTGGSSNSALTQRGEWESPVTSPVLSKRALKDTPWTDIDPAGHVFQALQPHFVTDFERTSWLVRKRDGSVVEVALDIGQIETGDKRTPLCELELELISGSPAALFEIAQQISRSIAVLPSAMSKAERGYALAQGSLALPIRAQAPKLSADLSLLETAQRVLLDMFGHFTANLNALLTSDDPEVVHQARIGWRRFKSARRLFRPILAAESVPSWQALEPLLSCLSELRDLDVALTETLPPLANAFVAGDVRRGQTWDEMTAAMTLASDLQRKAVRYALQEPLLGACLLATTQWLEALPSTKPTPKTGPAAKESLRHWTQRRLTRLHDQLHRALKNIDTPEDQHRVRILAKRMRYGIEAMRPLVPKRNAQRLYQESTSLQVDIGATRDTTQAVALVARLQADRGLIEFLRGVAACQTLSGAGK